MKSIRAFVLLAVAVGLSACSAVETVTRGLPLGQPTIASAATAPSYAVRDVRVVVPTNLRVSEANGYRPVADIVWRGDPYGNRYEQITAIFEDGMSRGAAQLNGQTPVVVDVQVARFHALTERARYTVGGTHSIKFVLTVRHAETGAIIDGPRLVKADLKAFGGTAAIDAERRGQTQKVRITQHLANVIQQQLVMAPRPTNAS